MSKKMNVYADEGTYETLEFENTNVPMLTGEDYPRYLIVGSYINHIFSRLEGKLLTVVEAISDDKEKREAIKSLVRNEIWGICNEIRLLKLKKIK